MIGWRFSQLKFVTLDLKPRGTPTLVQWFPTHPNCFPCKSINCTFYLRQALLSIAPHKNNMYTNTFIYKEDIDAAVCSRTGFCPRRHILSNFLLYRKNITFSGWYFYGGKTCTIHVKPWSSAIYNTTICSPLPYLAIFSLKEKKILQKWYIL